MLRFSADLAGTREAISSLGRMKGLSPFGS